MSGFPHVSERRVAYIAQNPGYVNGYDLGSQVYLGQTPAGSLDWVTTDAPLGGTASGHGVLFPRDSYQQWSSSWPYGVNSWGIGYPSVYAPYGARLQPITRGYRY